MRVSHKPNSDNLMEELNLIDPIHAQRFRDDSLSQIRIQNAIWRHDEYLGIVPLAQILENKFIKLE